MHQGGYLSKTLTYFTYIQHLELPCFNSGDQMHQVTLRWRNSGVCHFGSERSKLIGWRLVSLLAPGVRWTGRFGLASLLR